MVLIMTMSLLLELIYLFSLFEFKNVIQKFRHLAGFLLHALK